jgi:integrase
MTRRSRVGCAGSLTGIAAGAHLEEIKDHLGHASIRTITDRYGYLYKAARDRLRDHLDDTYKQEATADSSPA